MFPEALLPIAEMQPNFAHRRMSDQTGTAEQPSSLKRKDTWHRQHMAESENTGDKSAKKKNTQEFVIPPNSQRQSGMVTAEGHRV